MFNCYVCNKKIQLAEPFNAKSKEDNTYLIFCQICKNNNTEERLKIFRQDVHVLRKSISDARTMACCIDDFDKINNGERIKKVVDKIGSELDYLMNLCTSIFCILKE